MPTSGDTTESSHCSAQPHHPGLDSVLQYVCRQTRLQHDGLSDVSQIETMGSISPCKQDSRLGVLSLLEAARNTYELQ